MPKPSLQGKHILVTAGPTQEAIDPVRFLSNRSSGRMGYAIARVARHLGADVTLISGPTALLPPKGVRLIAVETAHQMRKVVRRRWVRTDLLFMVAAVADYRPLHVATRKLKKGRSRLRLVLKKTPDILAEIGRRKRKGQRVIGFAAETDHLLHHAAAKLRQKRLDAIFVNRVGTPGKGFGSTDNEGWLLQPGRKPLRFRRQSKQRLAAKIIRAVVSSPTSGSHHKISEMSGRSVE